MTNQNSAIGVKKEVKLKGAKKVWVSFRTRLTQIEKSQYFFLVYIMAYLFNVIDLFATLFLGGVSVEGNPFGVILLQNAASAYLYKLVINGILIGILFLLRNKKSKYLTGKSAIWIVFFAYGLLFIQHVFFCACKVIIYS